MDETDLNKNAPDEPPRVYEILTFQIAWQRLGVWPRDLREIVEEKEYVPIPFSPPFLKGIINCHGRVVTVVDFAKLIDLPTSEGLGAKRIVVLNDTDFMLGMLVPSELEISFFRGQKDEVRSSKIRFFKRMRFFSKDFDSEIDILDPSELFRSLKRYFKNLDFKMALPEDLKWI